MAEVIKVLSIDGGGIRAVIPALILDYIEKQTGRYTADLFDLLAGTSSGGIVALGLVYPGTNDRPRYYAHELADIFLEHGSSIFKTNFGALRQVMDEKYPHEAIERVLRAYLGDIKLREALKSVVVPTYDVENATPHFFRSRKADTDGQIKMWELARATSAAPTFFEAFPLQLNDRSMALIDGGMIANNPAMVALSEVTHHIDDYVVSDRFDEQVMMLSLGTGRLPKYYTWHQIKDWGALEWARPAVEITITGAVEAVDYQVQEILRSASNDQYYRIQFDVPNENRAMDDASEKNLNRLREIAADLIEQNRPILDKVIEQLI